MKHFGTTISESIRAFDKKVDIIESDPTIVNSSNKYKRDSDKIQVIGRISITILLLLMAIFLFSYQQGKYSDGGFTIIGAITGYWLK